MKRLGTIVVVFLLASIHISCGGGSAASGGTPPPTPPSTSGFSFSVAPGSIQVGRGTSADLQIFVNRNGFTGPIAVSSSNLPTGVTLTSVTIAENSSAAVAVLTVTPAAPSGNSSISLIGTGGTLSRSASLMLTVPLGGARNTIKPRTSGHGAVSAGVAAYLTKLVADFQPVESTECGSSTGPFTIEIAHDPSKGWEYDEKNLVINMPVLPSPGTDGVDENFDHNIYHESGHGLRTDILRIVGGVNRRGTNTEEEGFAQGCAYRVALRLATSGRRKAIRSRGAGSMLQFDTLARVDSETIDGGSWSPMAVQGLPSRIVGDGSYILVASQKSTAASNSMVEHEDNLFAALSATTGVLGASDRTRVWDSNGARLDGKTLGAFMPSVMIGKPSFVLGQPKLVAWPMQPQFPAEMVAQAFIVESDDPTFQPRVQPITQGALTITVKDRDGNVALGPIQTDFAATSNTASPFNIGLQSKPQGTYTVSVDAVINGTTLHQHYCVANIPFSLIGATGDSLNFPGQYLCAVDADGKANGGSLDVTRGTIVFSMSGFAIVKPDSDGTFDVTGPSGKRHTYTAPEPWARFIPVD